MEKAQQAMQYKQTIHLVSHYHRFSEVRQRVTQRFIAQQLYSCIFLAVVALRL